MRLGQALLILFLCGTMLNTHGVHAQDVAETATWRGEWEGDDLAVIVITRGHRTPEHVRQTEPWWRWGNTSTDAYLFYWTEDRLVDLILDFSLEDGQQTARLYIPQTQEQRLAIRVVDGTYTLPEGIQPALTLKLRADAWVIDGQPDFNLDIHEIDSSGQEWQTRVGGAQPGIPAWVTRQLLEETKTDRGYSRFEAATRQDPTVPYELAQPFMPSWPYLSVGSKEPHYGKTQPIRFDRFGRAVSQTWAGFHTAGMYQINSIASPPKTNFEAPFAFYRFDPDAGRHPNLVMRSDIWPKGDPSGPPIQDMQRTAIRMTWTADIPELWRYSLTVNGNHAMEDEIMIGDIVVNAVPYAEFPPWVTTKEWKAVTFVEATAGETGSEGIYDYSVEDNWPLSFWVNGFRDAPPDHYHSPYLHSPTIDPKRLKVGFRGEYSLVYNRVPQLYISPIDNRSHLRYAAGGLWNLNDGTVLRMHNLDAGPYINGWTRERLPAPPRSTPVEDVRAVSGEIEEALYALDDFLIYSGAAGATFSRITEQPANSDLGVPTDKDSWQRFLEQLAPYEAQPRDPHNLESWVAAMPGTTQTIAAGQITDVRAIPEGFRFVLTLPPNFAFQGDDLLGISDLAPGRYAVTYDGMMRVMPLTPPNLSASFADVMLTQNETGAVRLALQNDGLADLPEATLELSATSPQGEATLVTTQTVALLAQVPITLTIQWAPSFAGEWTLTPRIRQPDGQLVTFDDLPITVQPARATTPAIMMTISTAPETLPFIAIGLLTFAVIAGYAFWRSWRYPTGQTHDPA